MSAGIGRYAPSPTGALHVGNAFSALLAWAHARSRGGRFILRIEDVDEGRSVTGATAQIMEALDALGIDFDAGPPPLDDGRGPYVQTQRAAAYDAALEKLRAAGHLFACRCSRKDIREASSAPHGALAGYPGTCRTAGHAFEGAVAWRFIAGEAEVHTDDEYAGPTVHPPGAGGDFVVRRKDGLYAYHLAVVVDDAHMGVTHVVRGRDLLESCAPHALLYAALGAARPAYAHHPVLIDAQGARLSKRRGDETLNALFARGVEPRVLIGACAATLGAAQPGERLHAGDFLDRFGRMGPALSADTLRFSAPWGP